MADKLEVAHIETTDLDLEHNGHTKPVVGEAQLLHDNEIVLIPTPSADPNDPLNLPAWRKWAILVLVSAYGCTAVVLASGLGPIFSMIVASYPEQEEKTNDLMTYPTLFMGIGNLISMPLALTIGRRPVFLASIALLIVGGIWCAFSQNLESHIAGRDIMSLAAGQSEALAPLIVQEIFFLHERGRKLAWFIFIESMATAVFFIVSTYMTSAWGWRWWYGFFAIANGVVLILSVVLATETKYDREEPAPEDADSTTSSGKLSPVTASRGVILDFERYGPRTWKRDLQLVSVKPQWSEVAKCYKHIAQGFCLPSIVWLLLLNGAFLGLYIFEAATFSAVLMPPPYNFSFNALGYVQAGQILDCLIFLPVLGYGSDHVIKLLSRRDGGHFKPEYRLILIWIPAVVGVICAIIYGQAGAFPEKWHWSATVVTYNASYFAFLGANVIGITFAVDSFPERAAPLLVVICAGRGFISFGLSYATLPSIAAIGYDWALNIEAIVAGVLALLAIPVYYFGPRIRAFGQQSLGMGGSKAVNM